MTLASEHHELEDLGGGRYRHTQHLKRIAYTRDGVLRRITNAIGATGNPAFPLGVDELVAFRVKDKLAGQSPIVHFGRGNDHIRWAPLGTNNTNGVVSGQSIVYPGAWANCDLRLTIAGHRLNKDVVLRTGHPRTFQFRLDDHSAGFSPDTLSCGEFRMLDPVLLHPVDPMQSIPLVWGKSIRGGKTILTVTLPDGDYAGWTLDPTLTLQPDAADGLDTTISDIWAERSQNFGISNNVRVGLAATGNTMRGMIQFSGITLPAGGTLSSAALTLTRIGGGDATARNVYAHRGLLHWHEGTLDGAVPDVTDGSVWTHHNHNNLSGWEVWAGGEGGAAGTEFAAVATGSVAVEGDAAYSITVTADVLAWLTGTANYGWWLLGAETTNNEYKIFASSDNATANNRPKLTITYTLPSSAAMVRAPGWGRW